MNAIVVGTDGSPGAEAAIQKVIELTRGSGATVNLVCAYPGRSAMERIGLTGRTDTVDLRGVAIDVLARGEHRFRDAGFAVEKHAREGDPSHTIIDVAAEVKADLIAVGAHGTTGAGRILGSVASKLAHHAPHTLLIVHRD